MRLFRFTFVAFVAFVAFIAAVLTGCASSSVTPSSLAPNQPGMAPAVAIGQVPVRVPASMLSIWRSAPSGAPALHSFVADPNVRAQLIYGCALERHSCVWFVKGHERVMGTITGVGTPNGIGVDPRNGDVLIADTGDQEILVYPPDSTTQIEKIVDTNQFVVDIAVDGRGNIYAASLFDSSGNPGSVQVFDSTGKFVRNLTDANVSEGFSVSVDEHRDVSFCFNNTRGVGECDDFLGARMPAVERSNGWGFTGGNTFDIDEHLSVVDQLGPSLLSFRGSTQCGSATLGGTGDPIGIALDRINRLLYVADSSTGLIDAYRFTDCASGTLTAVKTYGQGIGAGALLGAVAVTPGVRP